MVHIVLIITRVLINLTKRTKAPKLIIKSTNTTVENDKILYHYKNKVLKYIITLNKLKTFPRMLEHFKWHEILNYQSICNQL